MKKAFLLFCLFTVFFSCKKEEMPPEACNSDPVSEIEIEPVQTQGTLTLPGNINNLNNLKVLAGAYEGTVSFSNTANQVTGSWDILLNKGNAQLVTLLNDDKVLAYTIAIPGLTNTLQLNEATTAATLVMMHPLMISSNPDLVPAILADIQQANSFETFSDEVAAAMSQGSLEIPDISELANQVLEEVVNEWASVLSPPTQNGIELTNIKKDNAQLKLNVINSRKRWLTIYAEKVVNGTGQAVDISYPTALFGPSLEVPRYLMASDELSFWSGFQLSEVSPVLTMNTSDAETVKLKCYGPGINQFPDPQTDAITYDRGIEALAYSGIFDYLIPMTELISGVRGIGLQLRGRPSNAPLLKIVELVVEKFKSPAIITSVKQAVEAQSAKDFVLVSFDVIYEVFTDSDNEKYILDLLKQFNIETSIISIIVKKLVPVLQFFEIIKSGANISVAIYDTYISDWVTEFEIPLGDLSAKKLIGIRTSSWGLSSYDFATRKYTELIDPLPFPIRWFTAKSGANTLSYKHEYITGNRDYMHYYLYDQLNNQQILYEVDLQTLGIQEYLCPSVPILSMFYNEAEDLHYFIGREIDTLYPPNSSVFQVILNRLDRKDCTVERIELETANRFIPETNITYNWDAKYFPDKKIILYWAGRSLQWNETFLGPQPPAGTYLIDLEAETERHFSSKFYSNLFEYEEQFYFLGYYGNPMEECDWLVDLIRLDLETLEEELVVEDLNTDCARIEVWGYRLSAGVPLLTHNSGGLPIYTLVIGQELHINGPTGHIVVDLEKEQIVSSDNEDDSPFFDYLHTGY